MAMAMAAARQAARDGPPLQGRPLGLLEAALAWRVAYEQAVRELGEDAALEVRLNERFHPPRPGLKIDNEKPHVTCGCCED